MGHRPKQERATAQGLVRLKTATAKGIGENPPFRGHRHKQKRATAQGLVRQMGCKMPKTFVLHSTAELQTTAPAFLRVAPQKKGAPIYRPPHRLSLPPVPIGQTTYLLDKQPTERPRQPIH